MTAIRIMHMQIVLLLVFLGVAVLAATNEENVDVGPGNMLRQSKFATRR